MTLAAIALFAALGFAESKALAVQIHLDRAGFSCSTIDGQWGTKSENALRCYEATRANCLRSSLAASPEKAFDRYFADAKDPFKVVEVTQADLDALGGFVEDLIAKEEIRLGHFHTHHHDDDEEI